MPGSGTSALRLGWVSEPPSCLPSCPPSLGFLGRRGGGAGAGLPPGTKGPAELAAVIWGEVRLAAGWLVTCF